MFVLPFFLASKELNILQNGQKHIQGFCSTYELVAYK